MNKENPNAQKKFVEATSAYEVSAGPVPHPFLAAYHARLWAFSRHCTHESIVRHISGVEGHQEETGVRRHATNAL
jgi:hypothetical protein